MSSLKQWISAAILKNTFSAVKENTRVTVKLYFYQPQKAFQLFSEAPFKWRKVVSSRVNFSKPRLSEKNVDPFTRTNTALAHALIV